MAETKKGGYHDAYPYGYASASQRPSDDSSLRYYVDILRRRAWTVVVTVVILFTIGAFKAFNAPRIYRATAKVLVERLVPTVVKFQGVNQDDAGWDPDYYTTQAELARSRDVLATAMTNSVIAGLFESRQQTGAQHVSFTGEIKRTLIALLGAAPTPPPEPWEALKGQIKIEHLQDTHFLIFKSDSAQPERAAAVANGVAAAFERYHLERKIENLDEAFVFLQQEKDKQETELLEAEKELQTFRESAKEVSLAPSEQDQPALKRLGELSERLTQVQLERVELTAEFKVIEDVTRAGKGIMDSLDERLFALPTIRDDATVSQIHAQLLEARKSEASLSAVYGPEHPALKEAVANAASLGMQFKLELARIVTTLTDRTKILQSQEQELGNEQTDQKNRALDLAKEVFNFARLDNSVKRHQKLYDALVERIGELNVSAGYVRTNARLVEKASVPTVPIPTKKGRKVFTYTLMGFLLGIGLSLLFENLDDTIKTPEDLKARLPVPLLGFVPRMQPTEEELKKGGKKMRGSDRLREHSLISLREPTSSIVEAYRNIRTRLFFSIPAGEVKIVGFTSSSPGEGKTTTASNLALVTAIAGKRVLLIDADFHRPMIQKIFGLEGSDKGLTSVLTGSAEAHEAMRRFEFKDNISGYVDVMPAGPETVNPSELLGCQKMKDFLAMSRDKYDWIFVDMPPVLFISDASIMSALCEGVVLVVKSARSNRSILLRTTEQLEELHAKVIGCVLNDVIFSRLGRYYSDYHYYGYSKYSSGYQKKYKVREEGNGKVKANVSPQ